MIFSHKFGSKKIDVKKALRKTLNIKKINQIINKTGPSFLRHAAENENTLTLAVDAFKKIKFSNEAKNKIKNIIFVTETPLYTFPGNAVIFSSIVNLNQNLNLFDLNAGCTGFVDAIKIASKLKGETLIACSETYSKYFKNFSRSISTIFSDCASIFIYQKKFKLIDYISGYEKNSYNCLMGYKNEINMSGSKVYSFVTSKVIPSLEKFVKKKKKYKIDKIYIHQASKVVIETFKQKFSNYEFIFPSNLTRVGNTNASTIPLMLEEDINKKKIKKGDNIIICGFGVGLSFSIALIEI